MTGSEDERKINGVKFPECHGEQSVLTCPRGSMTGRYQQSYASANVVRHVQCGGWTGWCRK